MGKFSCCEGSCQHRARHLCAKLQATVFSAAVVEISTSALNLLSGTIQAPVICLCTRTHTWACVHMCITNIMGICRPEQGLGDLQAFGLSTQEHQRALLQPCALEPAISNALPAHSGCRSSRKPHRPAPGMDALCGLQQLHVLSGRVPARRVLWEDDSNHVNVQTLPIFHIGYKQERTPCTRNKGSYKDTRWGWACVLSP